MPPPGLDHRSHAVLSADLTDALGAGGTGLEAVVALAAVAAHRVDAAAILADARLGPAFIQVWGKKTRR